MLKINRTRENIILIIVGLSFIFKDMQENAQNIINNMIENDRIKFVESIINKMIPPPDGTILTENPKEYVQKQIKESHKESATNVTFDYKELAPIFEGVQKNKLKRYQTNWNI